MRRMIVGGRPRWRSGVASGRDGDVGSSLMQACAINERIDANSRVFGFSFRN
jgi:hypothetical protein